MKSLSVLMLSLLLSGCAANKVGQQRADSTTAPNTSLRAFEAVCLKTAPSFAGAAAAAADFGITDVTDMGFTRIGMAKDNSIGVQIKPDKECVVTTPSQKVSRLSKEFLQLVGRHAQTPAPTRLPAKLKVNDATYMFHHDRKGGEAFVMLKVDD